MVSKVVEENLSSPEPVFIAPQDDLFSNVAFTLRTGAAFPFDTNNIMTFYTILCADWIFAVGPRVFRFKTRLSASELASLYAKVQEDSKASSLFAIFDKWIVVNDAGAILASRPTTSTSPSLDQAPRPSTCQAHVAAKLSCIPLNTTNEAILKALALIFDDAKFSHILVNRSPDNQTLVAIAKPVDGLAFQRLAFSPFLRVGRAIWSAALVSVDPLSFPLAAPSAERPTVHRP